MTDEIHHRGALTIQVAFLSVVTEVGIEAGQCRVYSLLFRARLFRLCLSVSPSLPLSLSPSPSLSISLLL